MFTQKRRVTFFTGFSVKLAFIKCAYKVKLFLINFTNEMFTINTNKQLYRKYAKKITLLLQTSNKSKLKFSR